MNFVECPLCKEKKYKPIQENIKDFEYDAKGFYKWIECLTCNLIRTDPTPTLVELELAYPPHYHAFIKPRSKITQLLLSISRTKLAKKISLLIPGNASILEIGCSTGLLLKAIGTQGNFKLFGVEYKKEAANEAKASGITVWQGTFENADIKECSMDLVIMQHVIEHVYNPVETLDKIFKILKPNGKLIGELPNIDSFDAYLFGKYWGGGHVPRHLWFFTPKTLKNTLEHCSFNNVKIKPVLHTGHWALSIQNFLRRNKSNSSDLNSGRSWYYPILLIASIPVNLIQMLFLKTGVMSFKATKIK